MTRFDDEGISDIADQIVNEAVKGGRGFSEELCNQALMTAQDWRDRAEHLEELEFKEEGRIRIWKDEDQHDT